MMRVLSSAIITNLTPTSSRSLPGVKMVLRKVSTKNRFYKTANVVESSAASDRYEVCLDDKKVRSPKGTVLALPNPLLAKAIAHEFNAQKVTIEPGNMHMFSLACTALDNPQELSIDDHVNDILRVLDTDTILFLCDPVKEPQLYELQMKEWGMVCQYVAQYFKCELEFVAHDELLTKAIPHETTVVVRRFLTSLSLNALVGLSFASDSLKSTLLALSVFLHRLTVEEAVKLASLESDYQANEWGRVEWSHDISYHETCGRVAAGILFAQLSDTHEKIVRKSG